MIRVENEDAYVIRIYDYSETDGIVVFYTQNYGKVRLIVKGLKRIKSPWHGTIMHYNKVRIDYIQKNDETLGRLYDVKAEKLMNVSSLELRSFYFLSYMFEIVLRIETEQKTSTKIFRLLDACIGALMGNEFRIHLCVYFQFWILKLEGILPDFYTCGKCKRGFDIDHTPESFKFKNLKFYCEHCSEKGRGAQKNVIELFYLFQNIYKNSPSNLIYIPMDISIYTELILAFDIYLSNFIGINTKSLQFLLKE